MPEIQDSYRHIMDLGQEELRLLTEGDMEQVGATLQEREASISAFLSTGAASYGEAFLEKLTHIQAMNTRLHQQARILHQSLKDELLKLRSENKRMGGYRSVATVTALPRALNRKG